jgi:hypothetical protein
MAPRGGGLRVTVPTPLSARLALTNRERCDVHDQRIPYR